MLLDYVALYDTSKSNNYCSENNKFLAKFLITWHTVLKQFRRKFVLALWYMCKCVLYINWYLMYNILPQFIFEKNCAENVIKFIF